MEVSLQYLAGWLSGNGAVALNGLMEDMATSEISLYQLKQWLYNNVYFKTEDSYIKFYLEQKMAMDFPNFMILPKNINYRFVMKIPYL